MSQAPPSSSHGQDTISKIAETSISELSYHVKTTTNAIRSTVLKHDLSGNSEAYLMIRGLEQVISLFEKEKARWCRRQNQEKSLIFQLPQEIFTEILLLAIDWSWWNVKKLRNLASVSTVWRDTILSCNRFWSVLDIAAGEAARAVTMKRNRLGMVDIWCWDHSSEEVFESFRRDVDGVEAARIRSVLYEYRYSNESFFRWLEGRTSHAIDLLIANVDVRLGAEILPFNLSEDGSTLRHVHLIGIPISPWDNPRFSNLRTLTLAEYTRSSPTVLQLYRMLSSSPRLERLSLTNLALAESETPDALPSSTSPIHLPVLGTLIVKNVYPAMANGITPLIEAPRCKRLVVTGQPNSELYVPTLSALEIFPRTFRLSNHLDITVRKTNVHICSDPVFGNEWVLWAPDRPGVDVKVAINSSEDLSVLWSNLSGWNDDTSLDIEDGLESLNIVWNYAGGDLPFPSQVIKSFSRTLKSLRFTESRSILDMVESKSHFHKAAELLGKREPVTNESGHKFELLFPQLERVILRGELSVHEVDEGMDGIVGCMEKRYPVVRESGILYPEPIGELRLPFSSEDESSLLNRLPHSLDWSGILRLG